MKRNHHSKEFQYMANLTPLEEQPTLHEESNYITIAQKSNDTTLQSMCYSCRVMATV